MPTEPGDLKRRGVARRPSRFVAIPGGCRSCLERSRQVEFLAGPGSPLVRWKWSPIRPVAASANNESASQMLRRPGETWTR